MNFLLILLVLLLFSAMCFCQESPALEKELCHLSSSELLLLRKLFGTAVYRSHFGYTLFGDKPLSLFEFSNDELIYSRAWEVWKRVSVNVPAKDIVLLEERYISLDEIFTTIYCLRKSSFLETVEKERSYFEEIYGKGMDAQTLLDAVVQSEEELRKLGANRVTLGILLGYGKNNALRFKEMLECDPDTLERKVDLIAPAILAKRYEDSRASFHFSADYSTPELIAPVIFRYVAGDEESLSLIEKYKTQKKNLTKIYREQDPLVVTLKAIYSSSS